MEKQATEYKCDQCSAVFNDADALLKHKQVHQQNAPRREEDMPLEQGTERPTQGMDLPPTNPTPQRR